MVPRLLTKSCGWMSVMCQTRIEVCKVCVVTYGLGHTDTGIPDCESLVLLVGNDIDAEILARVELAGVGESLISDLVQSIRGVGHQLSQENLLVGVDSVDDERQQLRNLSLELESLRHDGGYGIDFCRGGRWR